MYSDGLGFRISFKALDPTRRGSVVRRAGGAVVRTAVASTGPVGASVAAVAGRIARGRSPRVAVREAVAAGEVSPEAAGAVATQAEAVARGARQTQAAAGGVDVAGGLRGIFQAVPPLAWAGIAALGGLILLRRGRRR